MASEWVCIIVGTGVHRQVITAYAEAFDLETNDCGEYICVLIGTGPQSTAHHTFLHAYADAHGLKVVDSDTSCPE